MGRGRYVIVLVAAVLLAGCTAPETRKPDLEDLPRADTDVKQELIEAFNITQIGVNTTDIGTQTDTPYRRVISKHVKASEKSIDAVMMQRRGIVESWSNVLTINNSNGTSDKPVPVLIISTVRLYLDPKDAAARYNSIRRQARQNGGNVSSIMVNGTNVTRIRIQASKGQNNVMFLANQKNLLYYASAVDEDRMFVDFARRLFELMLEPAVNQRG